MMILKKHLNNLTEDVRYPTHLKVTLNNIPQSGSGIICFTSEKKYGVYCERNLGNSFLYHIISMSTS